MLVTDPAGNLWQRDTQFVVYPSDILCLGVGLPRLGPINVFETDELPYFTTLALDNWQCLQFLLEFGGDPRQNPLLLPLCEGLGQQASGQLPAAGCPR